MQTTTNTLMEQVLNLTPIQRVEMVEQILMSFDFPARQEIDDLWAVEAENRIDAYDSGEIKATSVDDVFEKVNR